jgi:hypothetical protein
MLTNGWATPSAVAARQRAWAEFGGSAYNTLYKTCWENPRPEVEITTIDLISDMTLGAPNIFAITLENQKSDTQLEAASSTELNKEALARLKETQGVGTEWQGICRPDCKVGGEEDTPGCEGSLRRSRGSLFGRGVEGGPTFESSRCWPIRARTLRRGTPRRPGLARSGDTEGCVAAIRRAVELAGLVIRARIGGLVNGLF